MTDTKRPDREADPDAPAGGLRARTPRQPREPKPTKQPKPPRESPQPKQPKQQKPPKQPKQPKGKTAATADTVAPAAPSGTHAKNHLELGAQPRAHLLPPTVIALRHAKAIRRRLGFGVIAVILLAVAGVAAATLSAQTAQANLATSQSHTQQLLQQELKYIKVRQVQEHVTLITAAQRVGASTEVDWQSYLQAVQRTLPGNVTVRSVNVDSASPLAVYQQSSGPLQGERYATLTFSATSPSLPEVPAWLVSLATLPGYADALPESVTGDPAGGYTVKITMHVTSAAFDNRFAPNGKK